MQRVKKSELLRKFSSFAIATFTLIGSYAASAFTYSDTDLLLVVRKDGYADLICNLGSVNAFVGQPIGSTTTINTPAASLIQSNFGSDLTGVKYILAAVTDSGASPLKVWLSDAAPGDLPLNETISKWTTQRSKVNAVGSRATLYPDAGPQAVIIPASDPNSYSYIASGGGTVDGSNMGGAAPFQVEQDLGASIQLFEIKVDATNPKPPANLVGRFSLSGDGTIRFTAGLDVVIVVTNSTYFAYNTDLTPGTRVYVDSDPAAGSPVRATQRSLGYREVDYKSAVPATLTFSPVTPATNGTVVSYDYSAQFDKTNTIGFWVNKDVPMMIGPDGLAYITDGHHTTAGYLSPLSPVRQLVPNKNRVILGHIVANFFNPVVGAQPVDDAWWIARAAENNALLYGVDGDQLILPGEPNYANLQPILPSVLAMPTTPSTLTTNGAVAMLPSKYRGLTWGLADAIVVSATDGANKKIAGYKKSAPGSSVDINFVEFFWADYLRDRIDWDDTLSGSPFGSPNGDASVTAAPLSFFTAVANGIALARSEVYLDRHGRNISAYTNSAVFPPNTLNWANGSISNGLAVANNTYHLYLRDDSTIVGVISPSAKSTNILHIDTTSSLAVTQPLQNIRTAVINAGGLLAISWKDTPVSNSTLRLPAGTGVVSIPGATFIAANTILGGGTLSVDGTLGGALQVTNGLVIGNGTIGGALSVLGSGAVSPGGSVGNLSVSGAITLGGQTIMELNKTGGLVSADRITGASSLRYGGTLTLTASGEALVALDTVKLFDAISYGSAFAVLNLPPLGAGLVWDSSRLILDGTLTVVSEGAPTLAISSQPASQTVDVGGSVTFIGGAVGTEPITYQWRFNGTDLPGKTSPTLTLSGVAESNQGQYDFVASNASGTLPSSSALLTVNQGPTVQNQSLVVSWNNSASITLGANDADGDALSFTVLTQPAHGALSGTAPNVTYTPVSGYVGPDSFTFRVNDGRLNSATATVSITVRQDFTYKDTDLLLVFRKDGFNDVLFNLGSVSNYIGLSYGTSLNPTNYDFAQVAASFGSDLTGVKYIFLATTDSSDAKLRVWLSDSLTGTTPQDETISKWTTQRGKINSIGALASAYAFPDATNQSATISPGNPNSYTYIASSGGTVDVSTMGGAAPFQVEQDLGSPIRLFELRVSSVNPKPFATELGQFTISTSGVISFTAEFNRAPIAQGDGAATAVDQSIAFTAAQLLANDSDPDGDSLSLVSVTSPGVGGASVSLVGGVVTYSPAAGFHGSDSFSYTISDGQGKTATGLVTILVTDGPLPPPNSLILTPTSNGFQVRFAGNPGRAYEIQRAAEVSGPWETIYPTTAPAFGLIEYVDQNPLPGQAFYRAFAP